MAKLFREVGRSKSENIKEKTRYMRIKRLSRSKKERQKSKITPAEWQEFIEI